MLQCCKCGKQYEFVPYESDLTLPVIVCPYCGLRHTVTFEAVDDSSLIVPTELKLATRPPVLIASRILNASRVAQAADDTDVTGWKKTNEFIVVFQLDEESCCYSYNRRNNLFSFLFTWIIEALKCLTESK